MSSTPRLILEGIVLLVGSGLIVKDANAAYRSLWPDRDIIGKRLADLVPMLADSKQYVAMMTVLATGVPAEITTYAKVPSYFGHPLGLTILRCWHQSQPALVIQYRLLSRPAPGSDAERTTAAPIPVRRELAS